MAAQNDILDDLLRSHTNRLEQWANTVTAELERAQTQFNALPGSVRGNLQGVQDTITGRLAEVNNIVATAGNNTGAFSTALAQFNYAAGTSATGVGKLGVAVQGMFSQFGHLAKEIPMFGGLLSAAISGGFTAAGAGIATLFVQQMVAAAGRAREQKIAYGEIQQLSGQDYFESSIKEEIDNLRYTYGINKKELYTVAAQLTSGMRPGKEGEEKEEGIGVATTFVYEMGRAIPEWGAAGVGKAYTRLVTEFNKTPGEEVHAAIVGIRDAAIAYKEDSGITMDVYMDGVLSLMSGLKAWGMELDTSKRLVGAFGKFIKEGTLSISDLTQMLNPTAAPKGIQLLSSAFLGGKGDVFNRLTANILAGQGGQPWAKEFGVQGGIPSSLMEVWAANFRTTALTALNITGNNPDKAMQMLLNSGLLKGIASEDPVKLSRILGTISSSLGGLDKIKDFRSPQDLVDRIIGILQTSGHTEEDFRNQAMDRMEDALTVWKRIAVKIELVFDNLIKHWPGLGATPTNGAGKLRELHLGLGSNSSSVIPPAGEPSLVNKGISNIGGASVIVPLSFGTGSSTVAPSAQYPMPVIDNIEKKKQYQEHNKGYAPRSEAHDIYIEKGAIVIAQSQDLTEQQFNKLGDKIAKVLYKEYRAALVS